MVNAMHPALAYLIYIVTSFGLLGLFLLVYTRVTPHREFQLIREGNVAAALSLGGAALGFSLTLSSSIQHNATFGMFLLWAFGAFAVQVVAYLVAARALGPVAELGATPEPPPHPMTQRTRDPASPCRARRPCPAPNARARLWSLRAGATPPTCSSSIERTSRRSPREAP